MTENRNKPSASGSKLGHGHFESDIGQPGVFLSCANGFNHFPCYQDIYVNCNGSNTFNAYKADVSTSRINEKSEMVDVENTHFGCGPCPFGFNYKKGYESRTYECWHLQGAL